MRISAEYYIKFIETCIKPKSNHVVSSNQIHNLFCAIFDLDIKHFSIKAFMPAFLKKYEQITGVKLEKIKKRVSLRNNTMRGIKGIILDRLILDMNNNELTMTTKMNETNISVSPLNDRLSTKNASLTSPETNRKNTETEDWETLDLLIKKWLLEKYEADSKSECFVSDLLEHFALYSKIPNLNNKGGRFTNKILNISKEVFPNNEIERSKIKKRQNKKQIAIPIIFGLKKIKD